MSPSWAYMDVGLQYENVLIKCLFSALEDLMREHMYCELTEKKTQNRVPVPTAFLNPPLTISGERVYAP